MVHGYYLGTDYDERDFRKENSRGSDYYPVKCVEAGKAAPGGRGRAVVGRRDETTQRDDGVA